MRLLPVRCPESPSDSAYFGPLLTRVGKWLMGWAVLTVLAVGAAQALPQDARLRIIEATVLILPQSEDGEGRGGGHGSGVMISENGHILTNFHVIGDEVSGKYSEWSVVGTADPTSPTLSAAPRYWARYVVGNPELDLAILKIERMHADDQALRPGQTFRYVEVGDANRLIPGDQLTLFGFPGIGGFSITVTSGIMSGWLADASSGQGQGWIKSDADVRPGNSGGGAFNMQGELIAIVTGRRFQAFENGSYVELSLLRPVNWAWPLIHASTVSGSSTIGAPPVAGTQQSLASTSAGEAQACQGLERLHFVTASNLQIRNTLRLSQEGIANGPHWTDARLRTVRVGDMETYQVVSSDLPGRGGYFLGLATDPKLTFMNDAGDFATALFSCVENLGEATLRGAYDFSAALLTSLAASGVAVLGSTGFQERFPEALIRFPSDACHDWECSNLLSAAWLASAGPEAPDDPGEAVATPIDSESVEAEVSGSSAPEAAEAFAEVERGSARMLWADVPRLGAQAQLTFSSSDDSGILAQGMATVTSVTDVSGLLTVTVELRIRSLANCELNVGLELRAGDSEGELLRGSARVLTPVAPDAEAVLETTVRQSVEAPADAYAVPIINTGHCVDPGPAVAEAPPSSPQGANVPAASAEKSQIVVEVSTAAELISAVRRADVVVLRPGTYRLERPLFIVSSIEIIGSGPASTKIIGRSGPNVLQISALRTADANVTIRDLTLEYDGTATADVVLIDENARGEVNIQNVDIAGALANLGDPATLEDSMGLAGITVYRGLGATEPRSPVEVTISHSQILSRRTFYGVYANIADGDVIRILGNEIRTSGDLGISAVVIYGTYSGTRHEPPTFEIERNNLYVRGEGPLSPLNLGVELVAGANSLGGIGPWIQGTVLRNYLVVDFVPTASNGSGQALAMSGFASLGFTVDGSADLVTNASSRIDLVSNSLRAYRGNVGAALPCMFSVRLWGYDGFHADIAANPDPRTGRWSLGCYSTPGLAAVDGWFRGSDNAVREMRDSGRIGAFKWPDVDIEALLAADPPEEEVDVVTEAPAEEPEEVVVPEPADEPEASAERQEFERAVYLPDPEFVATIQLRQVAQVVELAPSGGTCGGVASAFSNVPLFGDDYLDALRSRAMEMDACDVIGEALQSGEDPSSVVNNLQAQDAQLAATLRQAEHCVIQQATINELDSTAVIATIYDGTYNYGSGTILLDSCARAAVEAHLGRIGLDEVARQARTYSD